MSLEDSIKGALQNLLSQGEKTPKDLEKMIPGLIATYQLMYPGETADAEKIFREITYEYNTWVGKSSILEDSRDHVEWLHDRRSQIEWNYWNRYKKYLLEVDHLPLPVVSGPGGVDQTTDEILRRIENPKREGNWDRRGMVVGNVQSGKTGNYIGLVTKAVDAGYKVVIILAGLNNDLRSQTQSRVDKGFLGRDTRKKQEYDQATSKIGVGTLVGFKELHAISLTSRDAGGDYRKGVHHGVTITPGSDPVIAVVKKNVTPLTNLFNWFSSLYESGKIRDVPLLLIDDEADNASIDTKAAQLIGNSEIDPDEAEQDPSRINGLIRQILNCFHQSAYVGYTATPFANIFIYPRKQSEIGEKYGDDLFPRSFIISLNAPSNYLGPEKVFGLYRDKNAGIEKQSPLPLVRHISDFNDIFPEKHKKTLNVSQLPKSLVNAMYSFVLSCAVRQVRGQITKHNSMLIHVSRLNDVQRQVSDLVKAELHDIVTLLEFRTGPKYDFLIDKLENMWHEDYEPTAIAVMAELDDPDIIPASWTEVIKVLYRSAAKIEVKIVNKDASDGGLDYDSYPNGCNVIAIGGDKLSRGLTLEGLSVSYYIRASKMYDTLLQMGRWFGYRPGYADLCRLYTTPQLDRWYQHIAVANLELKSEFEHMAALNGTPENYGLKVRTHPEGMIITAMNKMRNSIEHEVTFAGHLVQLTRYFRSSPINQQNFTHTENWLATLGTPHDRRRNNYVWTGIDGARILDFLNGFSIHPSCINADPEAISKYIAIQNTDNELLDWTVALISVSSSNTGEISGLAIGKPWRSDDAANHENADDNTIFLIRNNLITEDDQALDLTPEQVKAAFEETKKNFNPIKSKNEIPIKASPIDLRKQRSPKNGLLLLYYFDCGPQGGSAYQNKYLGYAFSFPDSETAQPLTYQVDDTYWRSMYDDGSAN